MFQNLCRAGRIRAGCVRAGLPILLAFLSACAQSGLRGGGLLCEYRKDPLGIDSTAPRLSWAPDSDQQGQKQTAYQILVASDADKLASNVGDLWDAGKVISGNTIQIPYLGEALTSGQQCFWKVRVWDKDGLASAWSAASEWTMGILKPTDWQAQWIGRGDEPAGAALVAARWIWPAELTGTTKPAEAPLAIFRKTFAAPAAGGAEAWLVLGSKNPATAYIDGQELGTVDDPKRARTFDLAPLSAGKHALSVFSGSGSSRSSGIVGAIILHSSQGKQIISTDKTWDAAFEPGNASDTNWPAAKPLADYWDRSWGIPLVQGPALPLLRKEFTLASAPKRAVIYICGLGQFELHVNGQVVSGDILQPGWTDYRKTCLYAAYDVTALLKPGPNAIGVMLGNGMYNVTAGRYTKFIGSMGSPQLIAQMMVDNADGSSQRVVTDGTWKVTSGPITFSSIYGGEDFDSRLDQHGWDEARFNDATWANATKMSGPGGALCGSSRSAPPIRVEQVFEPVKVTPLANGDYVYDLGQNCAMIPSITVHGPAGATVRLMPGELLNSDGSVTQRSSGKPVWDSYTLGGTGDEHWSPRFTYYGSRYIQVHGAVPGGAGHDDQTAEITELQGRFITSSSAQSGEFSCSNELFNRTAKLIEWAIRSNRVSILTDCPHRERLGWLEQDHLMGPSLLYSHDMAALFNKISGDIRDDQHPDGLVADIAPEYVTFKNGFLDSPEWGSACVLIPWSMYQWYGDSRVLADSLKTMTRYVDYLGTTAQDNIVSHGLGDWFDVGPKRPGIAQLTPVALTATAFYYRDLQIVGESARLLGQPAEAAKYDHLARLVADAFNRKFYNPSDHSYATNSQTANALPVVFGLAPPADVASIVDHIVADMQARGDSLTAGDVGYRFVLQALAENGRSDEIFKVNNQSDRPGYGYQLAHGATSLIEAWNADPNSSQDHFMLGHILEWFYRDLAGIQPDPDAIAFDRVIIKPAMVGDVTWAKARYDSIRGPIDSQWERDGTRVRMSVSLPPGVEGKVYVPASSAGAVNVTGAGAVFSQMDGASAVFTVQSGSYQFLTQ